MVFGKDSVDNDELLFAEESTEERFDHFCDHSRKWKILIVDDEKDVHSTTRLVLDDVTFEGGKLEFISAYTGDEALQIMREQSDIAVILLDVVMETTHAGLDVARIIREEMKNKMVRIILRTGQPGQAPERKVIIEYDINDYKHKGELTAQRLFTSVFSALRSYRDILVIDQNRKGLKYIIEASGSLFQQQSISRLAQGVLTQVISLLGLRDSVYMKGSGMAVSSSDSENMRIIASTGRYAECHDSVDNCYEISDDTKKKFDKICCIGHGRFIGDDYVGYLPTRQYGSHLLYVEGCGVKHSEQDEDLLRIYSDNVGVAFDNIYLNQEILDTQKEIVRMLGEVVENRSKETACHVVRVSEMTKILGAALALDSEYVDELYYASPMHDVGKIGIPDSILLKPGKLTPEEFEIVKTHTDIGYKILAASNRKLLKTAAIIAYEHHEYWNGSGYPRGLKGDNIDIAGRITCISDVFDALCSRRTYKEPWDVDKALEFIKKNREIMFDPALVDVFFEKLEFVLAIQEKYKD
ncbi:Response regulator receiver domain-containing protein [Maridesulfovibrio ferrireducens]|uniref:Response regulator receiver domain-containing protein n=1 Tax=Maridesulfovibrio ferrireducens TaxID=246191 RepID=A0A1G9H5R1_9BACT|nr:response regulator [Maridesulfovibrio ferrireducens]SDL08225.1 Response regulator receiver domain-containing protein [Maridesulfovibrio ferrireducens]